jgi:CBS domain containing-hemolysin-like protein
VDLENLLGVEFYEFACFCLGLRLSILSVSSEVCFLVGLGEKMVPGSVVRCAENIINTVVCVRFHFFTYLVNWMISNRLFDVFLAAFGVPWDHFF